MRAVPDPDQVPRRGAAARGHPARARVRHEGLLLLRRRRRRARGRLPRAPRGLPADLRRLGVDTSSSSAVSGAMGGSASEEFLAESEVGEDTFVRCLESGYAANVEAVDHRRAAPLPFEGQPEAVVHDTPGHPDDRHAGRLGQRRGLGRRRVTAADTLKNVMLKIRCQAVSGSCSPSASPATARSTTSASAPRSNPAEYALLDDADFAKQPVPGRRATSARRRCRPTVFAISSTRAWSTAPLDHRRRRARQACRGPGRGPRLHPRRDHRGRRGARRRSVARRCRRRWCRARGIEIGHIFQLGRKYTDAFGVDVLGENGKPVRLTMGSYGVGVSRLVAVIAEQQHDEMGLRWPASVSPFDAHVVIANKDERRAPGADRAGRASWTGRAGGAARRPQGLARGEVQGRRAAGRAVDRRGRPRLGRGHRRAARPLHRRDQRTPSTAARLRSPRRRSPS